VVLLVVSAKYSGATYFRNVFRRAMEKEVRKALDKRQ